MNGNPSKVKILVSSSVYGYEELLERVYSLLTSFGYEVWMSHKGTLPTVSTKSAFQNCLDAVDNCDLFLGIITPGYGSGQDKGNPQSITHQEICKAIEIGKPRWLLAHDHVVFAWSLLKNLGYDNREKREALKPSFRRTPILDDLRVLDLYEDAILHHLPIKDREGNWVQKYASDQDGLVFVVAQFFRYQEVEAFIQERLRDKPTLSSSEGGLS